MPSIPRVTRLVMRSMASGPDGESLEWSRGLEAATAGTAKVEEEQIERLPLQASGGGGAIAAGAPATPGAERSSVASDVQRHPSRRPAVAGRGSMTKSLWTLPEP